LFAQTAQKENLPTTPTATDLNDYWELYRKGLETYFLDMGLGKSVLHEGLLVTYNRLKQELLLPYHPYPILILITDGQLHESSDGNLEETLSAIRNLGVQVICWYIASKNILQSKVLYSEPRSTWPPEALRLFKCSSIVLDSHPVIASVIENLSQKGWRVPPNAKLFFQINQTELIEELVEAVLNPLKD
jgi:hypothetical protein